MTRRFSLALAAALAGCVSSSNNAKPSTMSQPSPTPSAQHTSVTTIDFTPKGMRERIVSYDPPKHVGPGEWLTREIFFSEVPGYPKAVFRIPCVRLREVDSPHTSTEQCTAAKFTNGGLAGMIITANGEIITPP